MLVKINLLRKESRDIVYDSATQNIVNSPLLLYVIPYDSYGTQITDNRDRQTGHMTTDLECQELQKRGERKRERERERKKERGAACSATTSDVAKNGCLPQAVGTWTI
jgi:hypothetical protein